LWNAGSKQTVLLQGLAAEMIDGKFLRHSFPLRAFAFPRRKIRRFSSDWEEFITLFSAI